MNRPENMTPDEAEIWQRMELHGEELVRDMGGCHDAGRQAAGVDAGSSREHAVRQTGRRPGAGGQLDERPRGTVKEDKDEKQD